jgi:hypothetical protein
VVPRACLDVLPVADPVALPSVQRLDRPHLAAGAQLGPLPLRVGQVRVVERVLRPEVAAQVAFAAQHAGRPRQVVEIVARHRSPRHRITAGRREQHRQLGALGGEPECVRGILDGDGLAGRGVGLHIGRKALRRLHRAHVVVVLLEVAPADRPVLAAAGAEVLAHEGLLVLLEHHVRVDERPSAEPARDDHVEIAEAPELEEPMQVALRVPEGPPHLRRSAREGAGRVRLASFEDHDAPPALREPVGGHGAAETRAHHHDVEGLLVARGHHRYPLSMRHSTG